MDQFRSMHEQVQETEQAIAARNKLASQCLQVTAEENVLIEEGIEASAAKEHLVDQHEAQAFAAVEQSKFYLGAQNALQHMQSAQVREEAWAQAESVRNHQRVRETAVMVRGEGGHGPSSRGERLL